MIHNIELIPGRAARSSAVAGASAQLMAKEGDYAQVRLPSGEMRRVRIKCMATIGQVGNVEHENHEARQGRARAPHGPASEGPRLVMNPRDHPHGGGEGKAPIGHASPKTPWGKPALGYRTRRNKATNQFIVPRRHASA